MTYSSKALIILIMFYLDQIMMYLCGFDRCIVKEVASLL
jgi:hypothetical protein